MREDEPALGHEAEDPCHPDAAIRAFMIGETAV
jgi:hypothetical protein